MTTIATFTKPEEAHLLRMRLEAAGIDAFIQDENIIQLDILYSNALGGVRVQVADEDVQAVRDLLTEDTGIPSDEHELRCPKCGCTGIEAERFSKRFAYCSLLLLGVPLLLVRRRFRCNTCLHTWKPYRGTPIKVDSDPSNPETPFTLQCPHCATEWNLTEAEATQPMFTCEECETTFKIALHHRPQNPPSR